MTEVLRRYSRAGLLVLVGSLLLGGCATTRRAVDLAIDHHVGMARGAYDILTGEAEAREQRVAKLQADMEANRAALEAEQDQGRLVELLKQHAALQDALLAELLQHRGHHQYAHVQAKGETDAGQSESHEH
jgi:hypothetical protein